MTRRQPPIATESFSMVVGHTLYQSFRRYSATEAWSPAVNVYQVGNRLEVAVDLAGLNRDDIDVRVERGRLLIRGVRAAPEPPRQKGDEAMRILTMEIDYGPFSRVLEIPSSVDLATVTSAYVDGMLWITLPLKNR